MDTLAFSRYVNYHIGWIIVSLLIISKSTVLTQMEKSFNSHKTSSTSHIPWNMLLDPNYTSHKKTLPVNHTYQSPFRHVEVPSNTFTHHPHHSYNLVKEASEYPIHYSTLPPPQFSHQYVPQVNKILSPSEPKTQYNSFSAPVPSRPVETIMFPSNPSFQTERPEVFQRQTSRPLQKTTAVEQNIKRGETKKQKTRKPVDYFEAEDNDYTDSFYQDYDYSSENERPPYNHPQKQSRPHYPKHKGDPLGLLPSASDPDGFFAKAKDLLRGGSYGKPSYSATSPDYYSQYPPNKHYGEPEQPYYNDESYGNSGYPPKTDYYGSPGGYDYEVPIGDKYGGAYPYPDKRKGTKYGPLAFALGLLPLGLLLASLVPTVVTIPVTTAVATGRRRKRSVQFRNPTLDIISSYGMPALEDQMCLNRIFCEVVRNGSQETSSAVQKFYYKLAYFLDEKIADFVGLKGLIVAVRTNKCLDFPCKTKKDVSRIAKNKTLLARP